jgi:predicted transcriptional regulator
MRMRDREEIFSSILNTSGSNGGVRIAKIMFSSYLTHTQVLEYTKTLIERGFLEYDKINRTFRTTPSGFEFLKYYDEMRRIIELKLD